MKGRVNMEYKVIATYTLSNVAGIRIVNIEYGIDNKVWYLDMQDKLHKVKISYTKMGRPYFMYGSMRIYLDECMKTDL